MKQCIVCGLPLEKETKECSRCKNETKTTEKRLLIEAYKIDEEFYELGFGGYNAELIEVISMMISLMIKQHPDVYNVNNILKTIEIEVKKDKSLGGEI